MTSKRILTVTQGTDPVFKGRMNTGRPGFYLPVIYALEDGTTIATTVSSERKKGLPEALAREHDNAVRGSLEATFEDGKFFGTRLTVRLYTPPPVRKAGEHLFAESGGHPRCVTCGADEDDALVGGAACTFKP